MQPAAFLTVNVYVPAVSPLIVVDGVLPVVVAPPGFLITVQLPDGKPLNIREPVATVQVGCVIVPTTGAHGVADCAFTTTFPVADEEQPVEFLTVNVYVPAARPLTVVDVLLPVVVTPPGLRVSVHVSNGNPLNDTEPVATVQVGCVMAPTTGADGVAGCGLICTLPDAGEVHPTALVTLNT